MPQAIIKLLFYISLFMIKIYYSCQNCIDQKPKYMCEYIDKHCVPGEPLLDQLVDQRWLRFPNHKHVLSFVTGSHHQESDVMDKTHPLAQHIDRSVYCYCFLNVKYIFLSTMRLCNSRISKEYLVCYQTSQRNWVIIKMLYRYL